MEHDAWFFIGIFVFIFLVWVATGGPLHPISFTGPALPQPEELGGGTYFQLPRAPFSIGSPRVTLPGSSSGYNSGQYSPLSPVYGITFGTPSAYQNVFLMQRNISNASSSNPSNEYLQFSLSQNAPFPVSISGWKLYSEATGHSAIIPSGTKTMTSGAVNPPEYITLAPGERAIVTSGRSPVGASFRENKCTGFLNTYQQFYPPLPRNCPDPAQELELFYGSDYIRDSSCLNYVRKLSRCETVLFPPKSISSTCKKFVSKHLNYNACVAAHKDDTDFNGTVWRIYLGQSRSLWRASYEVVKLIDYTGKTVGQFTY